MGYKSVPTVHEGQSNEIWLYTTPLRNQRSLLKLKKPIDIFAHWAICIQGQCYELTRNTDKKAKKKLKYKPKYTPVQEWLKIKESEGRNCVPSFVGRTWLSRQDIERVADLIWLNCLQSKYVYDEQNCQVFIRLLVDLIGDETTKANFPHSFDKWVKAAGIARDGTTWALAAGGAMVGAASLLVAPVDPTGTAAAGAAISISMALRSSTTLITDRYMKKNYIEKQQQSLKKELRLEGIIA